jgi:hypothetical protein
VVKEEGESYRLELQRRIRELGLEDHVLFHPRFVELDELLEYIGATDIFVAPYHNLDQISSGALSYALGAGKAVVSTPFWHAEELLADGRGRVVPVKDPDAIAHEINSLLDDEVALSAMRKRAYQYCRHMVWSSVAGQYLELFDTVRTQTPVRAVTASALRRPISATNLPSPRIDHLARLTDDTGPAHHARYTIPDWSHGYRIEDAASALLAATKYQVAYNDATSQRLCEVYLSLVQTLIGDGRSVAAGMTYARHPEGHADDVGVAMVLWGLGYVIRNESLRLAEPALDSFNELLPHTDLGSPRAAGYAALGAADYLSRFGGASDVRRFLNRQVDTLSAACNETDWMNTWSAADWALPVQVFGNSSNSHKVAPRSATPPTPRQTKSHPCPPPCSSRGSPLSTTPTRTRPCSPTSVPPPTGLSATTVSASPSTTSQPAVATKPSWPPASTATRARPRAPIASSHSRRCTIWRGSTYRRWRRRRRSSPKTA